MLLYFYIFLIFRTMTVYAPAEHQPKLGRRRHELTEVRLSVCFSFVGFFNTTSLPFCF